MTNSVAEMINSIEPDPVDVVDTDQQPAPKQESVANQENAEDDQELDDNGQPKAKPHKEQWPKSAENAMSRRDKTIRRQQAQIQELMQRVNAAQPAAQQNAQTQQPQSQNQAGAKAPANAEPNEADYDNFGEYLKDLARWEARKQFADESQKHQQSRESEQLNEWRVQSEKSIEAKAAQYIQTIPDYQAVMTENMDFLDTMPQVLADLFYQADDAALAFYNLAKADQLENLLRMTPAQAAFAIGKAQGIAVNQTQGAGQPNNQAQPAKKTTSAPAPLSSGKGTTASSKPVEDMSADDLLKLVKRK